MRKLYLVTRGDLPRGSQAVQACHVALQFAHDHPSAERTWFRESNTLVLLVVPDARALAALAALVERADFACHRFAVFHEPDLGGALTAVALEPAASSLVRGLPLALG